MVVGRLELPKHQENPQLVCVEPAILPFEGILVARGVTGLFNIASRPEQPRELAALAVKVAQPTQDHSKSLVHVLVVNFTNEEVELPKATILGVGQQVSESQIAAFNDNPSVQVEDRPRDTKVNPEFRKYLDAKLSHFSPSERAVIEPVLVIYQGIFYVASSNDFKGTALVEHRIITGDAKPIKKRLYRVQFALRDEMKSKVENMLKKGVIEPSNSPWCAPCILIPKKVPRRITEIPVFVWIFGRLIRTRNSTCTIYLT
jgi:hypothetical protein